MTDRATDPSPAAPPAADAAKAAMPDDDVPPDLFHSETYEGKDDDAGDEVDDGPVKPGFSLDDVANRSLPGSWCQKNDASASPSSWARCCSTA